jgi:amidophosphoribosyltransferase
MAKMGDFIAFKAAIELLKDNNKETLIQEVYQACLKEIKKPKDEIQNIVKRIYKAFSAEEISNKIAEMLKTDEINAEIEIVYQSIEGLHKAVPNDTGDWYFSGNYPTPGGNKVVNKAFINYVENKNERAY